MERLKEDREARDVLITLLHDALAQVPVAWRSNYTGYLRVAREELITGRLRLVRGSAAAQRELIEEE